MLIIVPARAGAVLLIWLIAGLSAATAALRTNLYAIASGEYFVCCGIAGELRVALPNASQARVQVIIDAAQARAQMTILGNTEGEPIFEVFENGRVHSEYIEFGAPFQPGGPEVFRQHYIVSNLADGIRFNGMTIRPPVGADIPSRFAHSNVVARWVAPPPVTPTIRVAAVEICWPSLSGVVYQVQYRPALNGNTNEWQNLQPPVSGNDETRCVIDQVETGQPRRFYRVIPIP